LLYEQGKYYHIYNRGCDKGNIFQDTHDYEKLIQIIETSKHDEYVKIIAYSLMPNHYHLLVKQTTSKPVSKWIMYIFNAYVQYYNHRHNRSGTLFEGRAKVREINKDEYLNLVIHYIHSNPKAEIQKNYSSITKLNDNTIIDRDFYIEEFGSFENYFKSFAEYQLDKYEREIIEKDLL